MQLLRGSESYAVDFISMRNVFLAMVLIGLLFFVWLLAIFMVW